MKGSHDLFFTVPVGFYTLPSPTTILHIVICLLRQCHHPCELLVSWMVVGECLKNALALVICGPRIVIGRMGIII